MRAKSILLVGVLVLAFACLSRGPGVDGGAGDKKPAEKKSAVEIEKLVKSLGSNNPKTRDLASAALLKIGDDALPYLKQAFKADDPELRTRATKLHNEITAAGIEGKVKNATKYGIDTLAERMVQKRNQLTDHDWKVMAYIFDSLRNEGMAKGAALGMREDYFKHPTYFAKEKNEAITQKRAIGINVDSERGLTYSFVIHDGKIGSGTGCFVSLLHCNGDFYCKGSIDGSIVICDGNVTASNAFASVVVSSGKATFRLAKDCHIAEHYQGGLSHIRFFSIGDLGIEVAQKNKALEITKVNAGSLFAKAGLLAGDELVFINREMVVDSDATRKALRRALAHGEISVVLQRRQKEITVKIDVSW